jgi:hypothetical protein
MSIEDRRLKESTGQGVDHILVQEATIQVKSDRIIPKTTGIKTQKEGDRLSDLAGTSAETDRNRLRRIKSPNRKDRRLRRQVRLAHRHRRRLRLHHRLIRLVAHHVTVHQSIKRV